jgi:glycosyltransferase involved in cell wall biosynthesis
MNTGSYTLPPSDRTQQGNLAGKKRLSMILHIVPSLFGDNGGIYGGVERYVFELARHMAEVVPTRLLTFGGKTGQEKVGALDIRILGRPWYVRGQPHNPMHRELCSQVRSAEVVHCHQQHILASSVTALFGRMIGRRVYVTDHGGGGWDLSGYMDTSRLYRGHLHVSQYSRRIVGQEGRPWAHVIMGGVDVEKFSPRPDVVRDGSVVFVGRLLPHKGVHDLIKAVPPDLPLELIGRPYHDGYLALLKELAVGKKVAFRHDCDDGAIIHAYRKALCVVLPSVYRDCYGNETRVPELLGQTLLEGMACNAPAICTDVASMPEVVADGVTGFVVPPNDPASLREKLCWLRDHPSAVDDLGQAGRRRVLERFTWKKVVARCLDQYSKY